MPAQLLLKFDEEFWIRGTFICTTLSCLSGGGSDFFLVAASPPIPHGKQRGPLHEVLVGAKTDVSIYEVVRYPVSVYVLKPFIPMRDRTYFSEGDSEILAYAEIFPMDWPVAP